MSELTTDAQWERVRSDRVQDSVGNQFPYIRIKDHVLQRQEILKFVLSCDGFIPTVYIKIAPITKTLFQDNAPVDGDRVNVAFREDLKVFKSISADFTITSVDYPTVGETHYIIISGELSVPNLNSNRISFSYRDTADGALKAIAKKIGLGYASTVNARSADKQNWYCYNGPVQFIKDVTKHMWLGKDSFFNSWIDPFYNLTVVNVNDVLGRTIADDGKLEYTKYKNILGSINEDGKWVSDELTTIEDGKYPKLFTNIPSFENSMMYVYDKEYVNRSTAISKKVGTVSEVKMYQTNYGLGQNEQNSVGTVNVGVWYNQEKLDAGYVIADGPAAKPSTLFESADNGNYQDNYAQSDAATMLSSMSDGDSSVIDASGNNNLAGGNVFKMYRAAEIHNYMNNMELEKQVVTIDCKGANLGVARGEKVPMIMMENTESKWVSHTMATGDQSFLFDQRLCGWFYVKSMRWIYAPQNTGNLTTDWVTELDLTRREWMPPEAVANAEDSSDASVMMLNTDGGSTVSSSTVSDVSDGSADVSYVETTYDAGTSLELAGMVAEASANSAWFDSNYTTLSATLAAEISSDLASDAESASLDLQSTVSTASLSSGISDSSIKAADNAVLSYNSAITTLKTNSSTISSLASAGTASEIASAVSSASLAGTNITNSLSSVIGNIGGVVSTDSLSSTLSSLKSSAVSLTSISDEIKSVSGTSSDTTTTDSSVSTDSSLSFSELMAYDTTGLKHFMTLFCNSLDSEKINYTLQGCRRWALDASDNRVYGDAFLQKSGTDTYRTLDSDSQKYWLSDYNSRHYYGEAVDIIPSSGDMSSLLNSICDSSVILGVMHDYHICIQVEESASGASAGTHFHCGTENGDPQTTWWSTVNQKRANKNLSTYSVILTSDYYEDNATNTVVLY